MSKSTIRIRLDVQGQTIAIAEPEADMRLQGSLLDRFMTAGVFMAGRNVTEEFQ